MFDALVLLVVGFLLTSVVGGFLGFYFQTRTWRQRYAAERRDERHRQAIATFEQVSTLMDRRLYRMKRVWWLVSRSIEEGSKARDLDPALDDYRKVLFDWNDNINRLLALVQTYFGTGIRRQTEEVIFEEFASIGRALDHGVRRVSASLDNVETIPRVGRRLTDLSHRVYRLNVRMLELFEMGLLGDQAPESFEADLPWLAFGAQGPAVTELQRALLRAGYDVTPDGSLGPATHTAIRSLQHDHDLVVDGVVGPQTSAVVARYLR